MTPDICIYHGNCVDGFTAAWAVWRRFGHAVEYVPGIYGQAPPDVAGKDVLLVDFSYKRDVLQEMAESARSILVLDHHKTAEADLAPGGKFKDIGDWGRDADWDRFACEVVSDYHSGYPVAIYTLFDMNRSGAGIAWDFFHPDTPRPRLVDYVEDRDLWRFELQESRAVNAYIFAHEYTFGNWDQLALTSIATMAAAGQAIEKKHHKDVAELVAALKRYMVIGGHRNAAGFTMPIGWEGDR